MNRYLCAALLLTAMLFAMRPATAELILLTSKLDGAQVVQPIPTAATGTASMTYDDETNVLNWTIEYSGLENVNRAFFHVGAVGVNGPIVIRIYDVAFSSEPPENPFVGIADFDFTLLSSVGLSDIREGQLLSGDFYITLHTLTFPAGEIRGQVLVVPEPGVLVLLAIGLVGLGFSRRKRSS